MRILRRGIVAVLVAVWCGLSFAAATAEDPNEPIDLSSFSGVGSVLEDSDQALGTDITPIVPVDDNGGASWLRPYVTGIAGASFGTLNAGSSTNYSGTVLQTIGSVNEAMFTGGGAIGMALDQQSGLLRVEVEARARGPMHGQAQFVIEAADDVPLAVAASGGWSAMTNFWRDWFVTDRCGVYGGGGFGVGGYEYSMLQADGSESLSGSSTVNTFAWQVGTGFTYQLSDRVTFDTGYRFFAMSPGATPLSISASPLFQPIGSYASAFSASELLLSIRIYEPFRNWR